MLNINANQFSRSTSANSVDLLSELQSLIASLTDDCLPPTHGTNRNDQLFGTSGNDFILGYQGNDKLKGQAGNDVLYGDGGNDVLEGGDGLDYLSGGTGNDEISGGNGTDVVRGDAGNDMLDGGADNDYLFGGSGNDKLRGGTGNDTLHGGIGNDELWGGAGADSFRFDNSQHGMDTLKDFKAGEDSLVVTASAFGGPNMFSSGNLPSHGPSPKPDQALDALQFGKGAGMTSATTADQRFVLDSNTGIIYADVDGVGGQASVAVAKINRDQIARFDASSIKWTAHGTSDFDRPDHTAP